MNNPFEFNSFLPEAQDRNWVNRMKERYQNPEKYKQHLKEQEDASWEQAKTGGINEEMSRKLAEEKREKEIARKKAEEEKKIEELGPNFPKVWDLSYVKENLQKIFKKESNDEIDWSFFKFKVFVNETDYFDTNFYENLEDLKRKNTEKVKDIRKSKFNINENFFNAIASMYVLTWKSGFSLENISYNGNSKILQSLCKFHLYFWFKRFQKQPDLLRRHLDTNDYKFLMNEMKLYHTYLDKFDHTRRIWGYQVRDLNEKYGHGNWKNLRVHNSHYGQIGYSYQVLNETLPVNPEKQFVRFMREKSDGLNSLGQTFLVQSIEAFVYSILGSQADSRFSTVNQGEKFLQSQQIFHQLVQYSIVQNDNTIIINNFRTSIKDTNQILNQNISPGLLIIPSELTILKNPIPGYNNSITTSTQSMRFGVNQNLDKTNPVKSSGSNNNNGGNYEKRWTDKGFTHNKNPLGGTGNEGKKENDYSAAYFIGTFILGLIVFEVVIFRDCVKVHARKKINGKQNAKFKQ